MRRLHKVSPVELVGNRDLTSIIVSLIAGWGSLMTRFTLVEDLADDLSMFVRVSC